jgi:hypothetical protein
MGILRILLIQPFQLTDGGRVSKAKRLMLLRLSLPVLASLIPADFEAQTIDEYLV